jgi:hypothetical protein
VVQQVLNLLLTFFKWSIDNRISVVGDIHVLHFELSMYDMIDRGTYLSPTRFMDLDQPVNPKRVCCRLELIVRIAKVDRVRTYSSFFQ